MRQANEIRRALNEAIESQDKERMFEFATRCKRSIRYCFRAPRKHALKHAIDCVSELMGSDWLVVEPAWHGTRNQMRLVEHLRADPATLSHLFKKRDAEKFVKTLNVRKKAGSKTHAYAVRVCDFIAY